MNRSVNDANLCKGCAEFLATGFVRYGKSYYYLPPQHLTSLSPLFRATGNPTQADLDLIHQHGESVLVEPCNAKPWLCLYSKYNQVMDAYD